MKIDSKTITHILIRLLAFPAASGIVYLIMQTSPRLAKGGWRNAFFSGAAIVALVLMAEVILFFSRNRMNEFVSNLVTLFLIILFILFVTPLF